MEPSGFEVPFKWFAKLHVIMGQNSEHAQPKTCSIGLFSVSRCNGEFPCWTKWQGYTMSSLVNHDTNFRSLQDIPSAKWPSMNCKELQPAKGPGGHGHVGPWRGGCRRIGPLEGDFFLDSATFQMKLKLWLHGYFIRAKQFRKAFGKCGKDSFSDFSRGTRPLSLRFFLPTSGILSE